MSRRVVVTGMGWITPLGHDIDGVWQRLLRGESGVASTMLFDARTFPTTFSAEVKNFRLADFLNSQDAERHKSASRQAGFALAAASLAWRNAGLDRTDRLDRSAIGVYLGGGEGPIDFQNFAQCAIGAWNYEGGCGSWLISRRGACVDSLILTRIWGG